MGRKGFLRQGAPAGFGSGAGVSAALTVTPGQPLCQISQAGKGFQIGIAQRHGTGRGQLQHMRSFSSQHCCVWSSGHCDSFGDCDRNVARDGRLWV